MSDQITPSQEDTVDPKVETVQTDLKRIQDPPDFHPIDCPAQFPPEPE